MADRPAKPRKLFAAVGVIAGLALIVLEIFQPLGASRGERVFWVAVGVLLTGVGVAQLRTRPPTEGPSD